jgi:DNA sulfur modification protein DndC
MALGLPNEHSVFETRTLQSIYEEICNIYLRYPQPWVIGYSGGKDSTAVLQLVWLALEKLPSEKKQKPIFVIASDTKVETPIIVNYIDETLRRINKKAQATGMPFQARKVTPTLNNTFWVNLIGRGYPAPTTRFRWCTDRMKIDPANRFIEEKVTEYGEVIMVLGVRKTESSTRMQLMSTYQVKGHLLRRHSSLRGAYVYAPVADFSTKDVWDYLLQNHITPWGTNNRDLVTLYRNANAGECPLVIDDTTPSCGNSRFGCWVCTVATRDSSMESLVDKGEVWLEPLLAFRDYLATTNDPARKREFREIRGRDGRVIRKKDGSLAARTYTLDTSVQMLGELLRIQKAVRAQGPDPELELISQEELHEIRRIWRTERQDWGDSLPRVYQEVFGVDLNWQADDDYHFDGNHKKLLESICEEHDVPFELIGKMLEAERRTSGMARRASIHKELAKLLGQEWRSEKEIIEEQTAQLRLV